MLTEIRRVEQDVQTNTTAFIEYQLAVALRNYIAWYVRGESRRKYLEEVITHLEKSVRLSPRQSEAKCELAVIQIAQRHVRIYQML